MLCNKCYAMYIGDEMVPNLIFNFSIFLNATPLLWFNRIAQVIDWIMKRWQKIVTWYLSRRWWTWRQTRSKIDLNQNLNIPDEHIDSDRDKGGGWEWFRTVLLSLNAWCPRHWVAVNLKKIKNGSHKRAKNTPKRSFLLAKSLWYVQP